MPALAISASMRPHLSMVCLTRCATPESSLTEAPLAMASPPPSSAPPKSLITTFAPSLANAKACARPNPPPVPVRMATLSLKEMAMAILPTVLLIEWSLAGTLPLPAAPTLHNAQDGVGMLFGSRRRRSRSRNHAAAGSSMNCASKPPHSTQAMTSTRGSSHQIRLEKGMPSTIASGVG